MSKEKIRKVFLDDLPRKGSRIDWKNSIGYKVPFIYDDIKGEVEIVDYIGENCLKIYYNTRYVIIKTNNFKKCNLGEILYKKTNKFIFEIGQVFKDDKRDLTIIDREYIKDKNGRSRKWYKYKCNLKKCGYVNWIEESHIKEGKGCTCCANQVAVLGINTIWDTDRWLVNLGVSEKDAKRYTPQSHKKITVKCPYCGSKKQNIISSIYRYKSISCTCGDGFSYPEKLMYNILKQLNIELKTQYSPKYLKPKNKKGFRKRSDFYLPGYNLIVETDGKLGHRGGIVHSKSDYSIEECIEIDKWKEEQHKLHGVETIRINCFESDMEYIKNNILTSKLSNYFDFSEVDWNKCDEYAWKSNLKYEICNYWKNKKDVETVKSLSIKFELSASTISEYLKKGTKHGWCEYDPKEEMRKNSSKNGKSNSKKVEIFSGIGESLGVFTSIRELSKQSEELFGVKLWQGNISSVCMGKRKQHKGFTFKFLENNE